MWVPGKSSLLHHQQRIYLPCVTIIYKVTRECGIKLHCFRFFSLFFRHLSKYLFVHEPGKKKLFGMWLRNVWLYRENTLFLEKCKHTHSTDFTRLREKPDCKSPMNTPGLWILLNCCSSRYAKSWALNLNCYYLYLSICLAVCSRKPSKNHTSVAKEETEMPFPHLK